MSMKPWLLLLAFLTLSQNGYCSNESYPPWVTEASKAVEVLKDGEIAGVGQMEVSLSRKKIRVVEFYIYVTSPQYVNILTHNFTITDILSMNDEEVVFRCAVDSWVFEKEGPCTGLMRKYGDSYLVELDYKFSPFKIKSISATGLAWKSKYLPNVKLEYPMEAIGQNP
jgi:hypothetical protein